MLDTLLDHFASILWVGVCCFALFKGEQTERIGGGALLIGWFATLAIQRTVDFNAVNWPVMAVDVLLFVILLGLAWKSDRSWPVWGSGFQLIMVLVHIVTATDVRISAFAYQSALAVSSFGLLACLAIGTFWAWQEREAIRPDA
ncbi:hypothetical protein [Brevundimonas sp.]|uniref:hypothetical protein n=1 Tax=Brevundimonas sp. TaxID=1871086 RepID=UPI0025D2D350|nr:hypothetical protein [Brevundimonas sp.]